ncbi:MAG TPA: transposase [Ktedonobacterales bacterium]|jgi:transposase
MVAQRSRQTAEQARVTRKRTPTFLLELPLQVNSQQAKHLHGHFEAARHLYNALLCEAMKRLHGMWVDPLWQQARTLPRSEPQARRAAFSALRQAHGFSEYALHLFATRANTTWIATHLDANTAQTLATRAYRAANRVCIGQARRVRFKSQGRGLESLEGKTNRTGIRFVLQAPEDGNTGWLVWGKERIPALIDWHDPVVCHGLQHRIKYTRLLRRKASSPRAQGTSREGYRYYAQLALEGVPYQKPKHLVGKELVGLDLGPSTLALVPHQGAARLETFCAELAPNIHAKRRLQRKLNRQRRANNPQNYDEQGRCKKGCLAWHDSQGYKATRQRLASQERKLAAHRKSLHGKLVHEVAATGTTIIIEKLSYRAWQKQYGKSIGLRAPGMFIALLRRTVASTGGILHEVPTRSTRLSQLCHGCGTLVKKPLSERWHACACGIGPVQRDLYSAFLACHLDLKTLVPSIAQHTWESAETRLRAAIEVNIQRANAGQVLPQSMGIPRARAHLPQSLAGAQRGPGSLEESQEELAHLQEPPPF